MTEQNDVAILLARLQEHVPFLKDMIVNLKTDMPQHGKIVALHNMITDKRRKFKYDTLKKCEEVILKMKAKTSYKTLLQSPRDDDNYTIHSPDPEISDSIEKHLNYVDRYVQERPSVYSSAAESIARPHRSVFDRLGAIVPEPDISKPPISVADLELLTCDDIEEPVPEEPVVEKIVKKESKISLVPAPIIKPKPKLHKTEIVQNDTHKDDKGVKATSENRGKSKVEIVIKDASDSIFGNLLTSIDEKILVQKHRDSKEDRMKENKERKIIKIGDKHKQSSSKVEIGGSKTHGQSQPEKVYKRLADKYNPKPRKPNPNTERPKPPEELIPWKPLHTFEEMIRPVQPLRKPEDIPFMSSKQNPFENISKVDPRLQIKNKTYNPPTEGFFQPNGYKSPVWESPPRDSPTYSIPPSPIYSNPLVNPPLDNINIFSTMQQFPNRPNIPNIQGPIMNFQQNQHNFQRMPNPHMDLRGPSPRIHNQNTNFLHSNFNTFIPPQNRLQDPRINQAPPQQFTPFEPLNSVIEPPNRLQDARINQAPAPQFTPFEPLNSVSEPHNRVQDPRINQPPPQQFTPFEPLNSVGEPKYDFFTPPSSQMPNPYAGPKNFQPHNNRFQQNFNRNQYNNFNRDAEVPSTYKSWREERKSRDPRIARKETFPKGNMNDRSTSDSTKPNSKGNDDQDKGSSEEISRDEREKSVPRESEANLISREEGDKSREELPKGDEKEEQGKSVSREERSRSASREKPDTSDRAKLSGEKGVSRPTRNNSSLKERRSSRFDDFRKKRDKKKKNKDKFKNLRQDEVNTSLASEQEDTFQSPLDNIYTNPNEVVSLQNFKIPKKHKVEETTTAKESKKDDNQTEMKVTSSDDPPVVSSDQVSSTDVEETKGKSEAPKVVEKSESNLDTITEAQSQQLAELNNGLPTHIKEGFKKLLSNIKEHVGSPQPLLEMFGLLVDYIKPSTDTTSNTKVDAQEAPSSSAEVVSCKAKTDPEESQEEHDNNDRPSSSKQKSKKSKKVKKAPKKTTLKKKRDYEESDDDDDYSNDDGDKLIESVGERIKNRKRILPTPSLPKKQRKNELDKLHEDIKQTMGDGVLAVPTRRACTIIKEVEEEKVKVEGSVLEKVKDVKVVLQKLPELRKSKRKLETESNTSPLPKRKSMTRAAKAIASYVDEEYENLSNKSDNEEGEMAVDSLNEENKSEPVIEKDNDVVEPKILSSRRKSSTSLSESDAKKTKILEEGTDDEKEKMVKEDDSQDEICYVEPDTNYYLKKDSDVEYACKICDFSGLEIVEHYMLHHPKMDCLISRLSPEDTKQALKEAEMDNLENIEVGNMKIKDDFKCRFCLQEFNDVFSLHFYNHLTTHTCEFRFKCINCNFKSNERNNLQLHYRQEHKVEATNAQLTADFSPPNYKMVCGYVCSECNFLQLNKLTIDEHIQIYHLDDTACVKKINMSMKYVRKTKAKKGKKPVTAKISGLADNSGDDKISVESQKSDADEKPLTSEELNLPQIPEVIGENGKQNELKTVSETKNMKELDISVFMCDADIEEAVSLKVPRLEKMKEINESVAPRRTSIVNKLKDRLDMNNSKTDAEEAISTTEIKDSPVVAIKKEIIDPLELESVGSNTINSDSKFDEERIKKESESHDMNIIGEESLSIKSTTPSLLGGPGDVIKPLDQNEELMSTETEISITAKPDAMLPVVELTDITSSTTTNESIHQRVNLSGLSNSKQNVSPVPFEIGDIEKVFTAAGVDVIVFKNKKQKYKCTMPSCIFTTDVRKVFENHCSLTHKCENSIVSCCSCDDKSVLDMLEIFKHVCQHVDDEFAQLEVNDTSITEGILISNDVSPKFTFKISQVTSLAPKKSISPFQVNFKKILLLNEVPPLVPLSNNGLGQIKISEVVSLNNPPVVKEPVHSTLVLIQPVQQFLNQLPCQEISLTEEEMAQGRKSDLVMASWRSSLEVWGKLFKCPFYSCAFSSDSEEALSQHVPIHNSYNLINCLYCNYKMKMEFYPIHLVMRHRYTRHGCPYCLYRAVSIDYVSCHIHEEHKNEIINVLHFKEEISHNRYKSPALKSMKEYMKPYICKCNKKYIAKENITMHLKSCPENMGRFIFLNHFEYNCRYCSFGEPTTANFLKHMTKQHPFHPIRIITRHLKDPAAVQEEEDDTIFDNLLEITTLTSDNLETDPLKLSPRDEIECLDESSSSLNKDESDEGTGTSAEDDAPVQTKALTGLNLFKCNICKESCADSLTFKQHLYTCMNGEEKNKKLICYHCNKGFKAPSNLIDHIRIHGPVRINCSLCSYRNTHHNHLRAHMKLKHNVVHCKFLPADPKYRNIDTDEFIVRPALNRRQSSVETQGSQDPLLTQSDYSPMINSFGPDNIHLLPIKSIFNYNLSCKICNFRTKVRMNFLRHMSQHEKGKETVIPGTAPINPVPCLEKNELMFDKMTNLASSSHAGGRMGTKPVEKIKIPAFVPWNKRYVCGAKNCNYLCLEESMLKHHLEALHIQENIFTCAHCNEEIVFESTKVSVDAVLNHLRLHSDSLYKCSFCNFMGNNKVKVQNHCREVHPDSTLRVFTFRENVEPDANAELKEGKEMPERKKKPWKCAMCKCRFYTKVDAMLHAETKHAIDSQYKCSYCDFKTLAKETFSEHFKANHNGVPIDYIVVYYNDMEEKTKAEEVKETFDTTPLWIMNKSNQFKHIRGILVEEQPKVGKKNLNKLVSITTTPEEKKPQVLEKKLSGSEKQPATITTPNKDLSSNLDLSIEAVATGISTVQVESLGRGKKRSKVKPLIINEEDVVDGNNKDPSLNELYSMPIEKLKSSNFLGIYGPLGKPSKNQYLCPLCATFKIKEVEAFEKHLCQELQYYKYGCQLCTHSAVSLASIQEHLMKKHSNKLSLQSDVDLFKCLPAKKAIENWMLKVRTYQTRLINAYCDKVKKNNTTSTSTTEIRDVTPPIANISQSLTFNEDPEVDPLGDLDEVMDEELEDPSKLLVELKRVSADCEENREGNLISIDKAIKPYVCSLCDYKTKRYGVMQKHIKNHQGFPVLMKDSAGNTLKRGTNLCFYCSIDSVHRHYLMSHHMWRHPDKVLAIVRHDEPENVLKIPPAIVRLKCGHCELSFKDVGPLKEHYFAQHSSEDFVYIEFGSGITSEVKAKETARKSTGGVPLIDKGASTSQYGKKPDLTEEECKRITTTLKIMNNFVNMNVGQVSKLLNIFPRVEVVDYAKEDTAS